MEARACALEQLPLQNRHERLPPAVQLADPKTRYRRLLDIRIQCVVVDSADCERLARFWLEALGWRITFESEEEYAIEPPKGAAKSTSRRTCFS
jgi:hypothetical protein